VDTLQQFLGSRILATWDWTSAAKEASLADIGEGPAMDDDTRDLGNRLFATATAMLEDAIEVAVAGQSLRLNPAQLADTGRRLQAAARDIAIIAEAAMIIINLGDNRGQNPRKSRR
jgi:hypothetical protein